jgi:large subunit ribosomal protein L33
VLKSLTFIYKYDKLYKLCSLKGHSLKKRIVKTRINKVGGGAIMAAKGPRENITLECTECKRRNYMTSKNKRNDTDRLEVEKYCKYCKKRTTHKETK